MKYWCMHDPYFFDRTQFSDIPDRLPKLQGIWRVWLMDQYLTLKYLFYPIINMENTLFKNDKSISVAGTHIDPILMH